MAIKGSDLSKQQNKQDGKYQYDGLKFVKGFLTVIINLKKLKLQLLTTETETEVGNINEFFRKTYLKALTTMSSKI